jgi:hypothetical protein
VAAIAAPAAAAPAQLNPPPAPARLAAAAAPTAAAPLAAQPANQAAAGAVRFSFEDGGTDGWGGHGNVTSLGSATTAHDGSRSLRAGLFSSGGSDLPYVSVVVSGSSAPAGGQTLTAFVLATGGGPAIQGKLFVQDTSFAWHLSSLVGLPQGVWTALSLRVPSGIRVNQLGVQFLCTPAKASGAVLVDSVGWS